MDLHVPSVLDFEPSVREHCPRGGSFSFDGEKRSDGTMIRALLKTINLSIPSIFFCNFALSGRQ